MNKKIPIIILSAGALGIIAYSTLKPVDDFVNNFRFYIKDYDIDFTRISSTVAPATVDVTLINSDDYEPVVDSIVATLYVLDDDNEWQLLATSTPQPPFKIPARLAKDVRISLSIPFKSGISDLLNIASKFFKGKKSTYKIQVNTKVAGQILVQEKLKEF